MLPTSTNASVQIKDSVPASAEAIVVFAAEGGGAAAAKSPLLSPDERRAVERLFSSGVAKAKSRETATELVERAPGKFRRVVVVGLGKSEKITPETVRQSAGAAYRALRRQRLSRIAVIPPAP